MKSTVLANWNMPLLSSFALLLFVAVFAGVLFLIFRKNSKDLYNNVSQMPLNEGSNKND